TRAANGSGAACEPPSHPPSRLICVEIQQIRLALHDARAVAVSDGTGCDKCARDTNGGTDEKLPAGGHESGGANGVAPRRVDDDRCEYALAVAHGANPDRLARLNRQANAQNPSPRLTP